MASKAAAGTSERLTVENVNVHGYNTTVDAAMYRATHRTLLKVLPTRERGPTQAELFRAVVGHLRDDLLPDAVKASWWVKTVQSDHEAKGASVREPGKPLRRQGATKG